MRVATRGDLDTLLGLMGDFYAESGYVLDRPRAAEAFAHLLGDPRLGRVWIVEQGGRDVGYLVLTFVFGMEYGGLMAVVDDFYIRPAWRNAGVGTAALAAVRESCAGLGVRAVSVEVGRENAVARSVYRRAGFSDVDRLLMTLRLGRPTHVE